MIALMIEQHRRTGSRFGVPASVAEASRYFLADNDALGEFLSVHYEMTSSYGDCVKLKDMFQMLQEAPLFGRQLQVHRASELSAKLRARGMTLTLQKGVTVVRFILRNDRAFQPPTRGDGGILNDTSSLAERAFRVALQERSGLQFVFNHRPGWLRNPETGACLELDMYAEEQGVAVEYDGPQHREFPNPYHASREEFESLLARDRLKERLCAARGVRLIRVIHREDMECAVREALNAIAA